ncbi:MAG: hypothetical protein JOY86_00005 [Candidatus Eremiobacteraeota bacterium]|nr:hypothetical protein [Candidatus Eremiobacteraeota bacterium]
MNNSLIDVLKRIGRALVTLLQRPVDDWELHCGPVPRCYPDNMPRRVHR